MPFEIPIIENIDTITSEELEIFKYVGIAYIRVTNSSYATHLTALNNKALKLFRSSDLEKQQYNTLGIPKPERKKTSSDGYVDRRSKHEHLETFRQPVSALLPPFDTDEATVKSLSNVLIDELAVKVLKKIIASFASLEGVDVDALRHLSERMSTVELYLAFVYYPGRNFLQRLIHQPRINPHKDINLITIIMLQQPGLQFWADGYWVDVLPKPGYAAALLNDELNLLTNGRTRACLHAVRMTSSQERLSTLFFVGPKNIPNNPMSTITGCELPDFFTNKRYLKHVFTDREAVSNAYNAVSFKLNMAYVATFACVAFASWAFYSQDNLNASKTVNYAGTHSYKLPLLFSAGFTLLNTMLHFFKKFHFESRMLMDYLQYSTCSDSASESEQNTYQLGKSALTVSGMFRSIFNRNIYRNPSFWNAGFMSSVIESEAAKQEMPQRSVFQKPKVS